MVAMAMDDWESRTPCPDGRCTGVLDDAATCGTCGRRSSREGGSYRAAPEEVESSPTTVGPAADDPWEARIPCPDGSCTGILGDDGACGTCGRRG